jgi:hypothetical protein
MMIKVVKPVMLNVAALPCMTCVLELMLWPSQKSRINVFRSSIHNWVSPTRGEGRALRGEK